MSDNDEPNERESIPYRSLVLAEPGGWYWLGVMFPHLVRSLAADLEPSLARNAGYGAQCDVTAPGREHPKAGRAVFNRPGADDAPASVLLYSFDAEFDAFWDGVAERLQAAQQQARMLRRTHEGVTPYEAIEIYYRARAAGSRATLRDIAEQYGHNYDYLRKVKRQYDAAGKWGSKKEPIGSLHGEE